MLVDPKKVCYTYIAQDTCTSQQLAVLALGTAVIENYVVIGYQSGNGVVYY